MKKTGAEELEVECTKLRREIQRELRRAYWRYISETLTSEDDETKPTLKRF